jgi:hypothetical protein
MTSAPPCSPGPWGSRWALQGTVIAKLLIFPALVLLLTGPLPLATAARDALVLQAAAPTAISVLLMAETQQRDHHAAALVVGPAERVALAGLRPAGGRKTRKVRLMRALVTFLRTGTACSQSC